MSAPGLCDQHQALASFRCEGCGQWLCYDCVDEGDGRFLASVVRCKLCGEPAVAADEIVHEPQPATTTAQATTSRAAAEPNPEAIAEADDASAMAVPDILYTPPPEPASDDLATAFAPTTRGRDATPAFLLFAHHVVVPAATLVMVTALLFFLLDLRSIYLGESDALKWLGFWFVTATVLIARYGKMSTYETESDRQSGYTVALTIATVLVMIVSPWEEPGSGWLGPIVNSAIFLAVWRFATRLTASLSLEGEEWWTQKPRFYGLERLAVEELASQREDRSILSLDKARKERAAKARARTGKSKPRGPGNPSLAVARLALLALLIFALAEPLVLAAPPGIGERAAAAMIIFLFATGVVLGAASSVASYRRVRAAGGRTSVGVIPGRLAVSAALMAVILAVALTLPGSEFQGSGELQPQSTPPVTEDASRQSDRNNDPAEAENKIRRQGSPAGSLLAMLSSLGRLLKIPFLIAVAILVGLGLWRLWPLLADIRKKLFTDLSSFWARLRAIFSGLFGSRRAPKVEQTDPLGDIDALRRLPPRDAVLDAYGRVLLYFEQNGYPRPERQTPYEFLSQTQNRFRDIAAPLARLTEAYVTAAYSHDDVDDGSRHDAVNALIELAAKGPLTPRTPTS